MFFFCFFVLCKRKWEFCAEIQEINDFLRFIIWPLALRLSITVEFHCISHEKKKFIAYCLPSKLIFSVTRRLTTRHSQRNEIIYLTSKSLFGCFVVNSRHAHLSYPPIDMKTCLFEDDANQRNSNTHTVRGRSNAGADERFVCYFIFFLLFVGCFLNIRTIKLALCCLIRVIALLPGDFETLTIDNTQRTSYFFNNFFFFLISSLLFFAFSWSCSVAKFQS